jgi:Mg2+-importing ATPase
LPLAVGRRRSGLTSVVAAPTKWDLPFIRRFMLAFGLLSSVFDYLSFGLLLWVFKAQQSEFQTGWFVESVLSASIIVLVVRTPKSFYRSRPGTWLIITTAAVAVMVMVLPLTPAAAWFGFTALPWQMYLSIIGIVTLYIFSAEALKRWFYRKVAKR